MLETELKRMGRKELLDVLADQEEELESLRAHLVEVERKLADRNIQLEQAGSIAEASLVLNGVFEAAEAAAAQYVESIEALNSRQEAICAKREQESKAEAEALRQESRQEADTLLQESRRQAETLLQEARAEADALLDNARRLEDETKRRCEQLKTTAKREADDYWDRVSWQLEQFCQSREELRDLLSRRRQSSRELKDEIVL